MDEIPKKEQKEKRIKLDVLSLLRKELTLCDAHRRMRSSRPLLEVPNLILKKTKNEKKQVQFLTF